MKAIHVLAYGGPEALTLVDIERPTPKAGEALIRIAAAGVNYTDITQRAGKRPGTTLPLPIGMEGAGTIEAVGDGVTEIAVGDRVMYAMVSGSYAEYATVPASMIVRIPPEVDFTTAAALALQGLTAHYLLHEFRHVEPGTTVLIHAVAGGVGLLVTQYAKHLGAHVIGTTSTEEKAAKAKAMGADDVILYTQTNFAEEVQRITGGKGADLILDSVSKTTFPGDLDAAAKLGHIVVFGASSGQADPISPNRLSAKGLTISGAGLLQYIAARADLIRRADDLFAGVKAGWLKLAIGHEFPLAEAAEAHRLLESRATSGKLILTI